jgi:cytochrome b involved in lipid metabolism
MEQTDKPQTTRRPPPLAAPQEAKATTNTDDLKEITEEEVQLHDGSEDGTPMWMILHGYVLDVTEFASKHPGGAKTLKKFAGQDGTKAFEALYHSEKARKMVKPLVIGRLKK